MIFMVEMNKVVERLLKINNYGKDNPYGPNSVDTSANVGDGQYVIR